MFIRYYPLAFMTIGFIAKESGVKVAAILLGIHLMVAPIVYSIGKFDFFAFNAIWGLAAIIYCLFLGGHIRKLLLILICSASFYLNAYNQLFFSVDDLSIYTYYTQINTALLEIMLAVLASYVQGRKRQIAIFCIVSTLFLWLRF